MEEFRAAAAAAVAPRAAAVLDAARITAGLQTAADGVHYPTVVYDVLAGVLANQLRLLDEQPPEPRTPKRPGSMAKPAAGAAVAALLLCMIAAKDSFFPAAFVQCRRRTTPRKLHVPTGHVGRKNESDNESSESPNGKHTTEFTLE